MKIQSSQPESESQLTTNSTPGSAASAPTDILFDLLIQNMIQSMPDSENQSENSSDLEAQPEGAPLNETLTSSELTQIDENALILAQMNLNEKMSRPATTIPTAETAATTDADLAQTAELQSKNPVVDAELALLAESKTPVANTPAIKDLLKETAEIPEDPEVQVDIKAQAKNVAAKNAEAGIGLENINKEAKIDFATSEVKKAIQKASEDLKEDFLTKLDIKTTPNKPAQEVVQSQMPQAVMLPTIIEKPEILSSSKTDLPEMKPMDFFLQLNQFINHQVGQQANTKGNSSIDLAQTKGQFGAMMQNLNNMDFNLKVELLNPEKLLSEVHEAKININPPELGSVLARLRLDRNNAELTITAENHHVKHIIESNLPLLRQHFQNANINLTDVQVQTNQTPNEKGQNQNNNDSRDQFLNDASSTEVKKDDPKDSNLPKTNSIIDTYA